ncbi:MAG TPA: hypothetical protein VGM03_06875, partial [Phycisphaerae bacterium]
MRNPSCCLGILLLSVTAGCRHERPNANSANAGARAPTLRTAHRSEITIDFPPQLRVADDSVNDFVHNVLATCASGDYDRFRKLWSAREDPFPRDRYERAWRSVRKVTLLQLQARRNARDGQLVYVVHATAELDPSVPKSEREIVVVLIREDEAWRLIKPPKHIRQEIL